MGWPPGGNRSIISFSPSWIIEWRVIWFENSSSSAEVGSSP